jgi:hypothetical protein
LLTKIAGWRLIIVILLTLLALRIQSVNSTRPIVNSIWTDSPPNIDGKFTPAEWTTPQIIFKVPPNPSSYLNAYVYFVNDNAKLYVMVDAVGDQTDDRLDEALLIFNFTSPMIVAFRGAGGFECTELGINPDCRLPQGSQAVVGYGTSPNSTRVHKMYEMSIPLRYLAGAGQSVDLSSPKANVFNADKKGGKGGSLGYDERTGRDNVWPLGLDSSHVETWGILVLASATQAPENTEFTLPACLMLVGIAFIVAKRGRRN